MENNDNNITIISFNKSPEDVANLNDLPAEARRVFDQAERLQVRGFQELNGYIGRQCIFSCGGRWDNNKFHITSMGNGEQLFVA